MDIPSKPAEATGSEGEAGIGFERLVFFSDAVFAIAITLLALELHLPDPTGPVTTDQFAQLLLGDMLPKYLGFVVSFVVIGVYWVLHHRDFTYYIRRYDQRLIWLNLLMLMTICFLPFSTSVQNAYGGQPLTVAFYATSVAAVGIVHTLMWLYASAHHRLIDPSLSPQFIRTYTLRSLAVPAVFLLSIGLVPIHPDLARFSWLLLIPLTIIRRRAAVPPSR